MGRRALLLAALVYLCAFSATSSQAVVYNVPPQAAPQSIGANTTLNLANGGVLPTNFTAGTQYTPVPNIQLNIAGGTVGDGVQIYSDAVVNVSGGSWGDGLVVDTGVFTVIGNEFRLNGVPVNVAGTVNVTIPSTGLLTGTLADGTSFAFYNGIYFNGITSAEDYFSSGVIRLQSASLPAVGPAIVNVASGIGPTGVRSGQTLNLQSGGSLPDNFNAGSGAIVNIAGGSTGRNFETVATTVTVSGGSVGDAFDAFGGTVNLTGGTIGNDFTAFRDAVVNISGGTLGDNARTFDNSTVNISGGTVGNGFSAEGGQVNISGGRIGDGFRADGLVSTGRVTISGGTFGDSFVVNGGAVTLVGDDFRVDGQPVAGLNNIGDTAPGYGGIISGTLADGTPFVFTGFDHDTTQSGFTLRKAALPAAAPNVVVGQGDTAPLGVRNGQTLTVNTGGAILDNFNAGAGSTVTIAGGSVGKNFEAIAALVSMTSGAIGDEFDAFPGSTVQISGGSVGNHLEVFHDSVLTISGGTVGYNLTAQAGSVINVAGGTVQDLFLAKQGSVVNISAGQIGDQFSADQGTQINLSGGAVGGRFTATGFNAPGYVTTINITGGSIGTDFEPWGTQVNLSGGSIGNYLRSQGDINGNVFTITGGAIGDFAIFRGTDVINMSGGRIGDAVSFAESAQLNLSGTDFRVNGVPVTGLDNIGDSKQVVVPAGATITGTLADGSPFVFMNASTYSEGEDYMPSTGLTLRRAAVASTLAITTISSPSALGGVPEGHTMIVAAGGLLGDSITAGYSSTLHVDGGTIGHNLEIVDANMDVTAGSIGDDPDAFGNSHVTISGGQVGNNFQVWGTSTVDITGGTVGDYLIARNNSTVHISGGSVGAAFLATMNSHVIITGNATVANGAVDTTAVLDVAGGSIGSQVYVRQNGTLNVSGGAVGTNLYMQDTSKTNLSAGSIDNAIYLGQSATLSITGGTLGDGLSAPTGTHVEVFGGEFRINGTLIGGLSTDGTSLQYNMPAGSVLSGTLADGTPFAFMTRYTSGISPLAPLDSFANGTLTLHKTALPDITPTTINVASQSTRLGVRSGQTLQLLAGGSLPDHFNAGLGSTVNISGGTIGRNFEAVGAAVNVSGGVVGDSFEAVNNSVVNMTGGSIGNNGSVHHGAQFTMTGGTIGTSFAVFESSRLNVFGGSIGSSLAGYTGTVINIAGGAVGSRLVPLSGATVNLFAGSIDTLFDGRSGSVFNMTGGSLATRATAETGSKMNISGGAVGDLFEALSNSEVNLFGTDFQLNGTPIANLVLGQKFTVTSRMKILTGHFVDGSPFSFNLNNNFVAGQNYFASTALLTVTLLQPFLAGDFNRNGIVDAADYVLWRKTLGQTVTKGIGADANFNGLVDDSDLLMWRLNFGHGGPGTGSSEAIPEPSIPLLLAALSAIQALAAPRRRYPR